MLADFNKNTNRVEARDFYEYLAMKLLLEIKPDLEKQGKKVTVGLLRELRDNWKYEGKTIDFRTDKLSYSKIRDLLVSTGSTSFGRFGDITDKESFKINAKDFMDELKEEYNESAKKGDFLHVLTDPLIREVTEDNGRTIKKAVFIHKGKSFCKLNPGENANFVHANDKNFKYSPKIVFKSEKVESEDKKPKNNTPKSKKETPKNDFEEINLGSVGAIKGWNGDDDFPGLKHVLGAYFTKAEQQLIESNIDSDAMFNPSVVSNSLGLIRHMRSNGYDFDINKNHKHKNQIQARMKNGSNVQVKLFDNEKNGAYIGRVYDDFNQYYLNTMGDDKARDNAVYNLKDNISVLDYVIGGKTGKVEKYTSTPNSRITMEGFRKGKYIQVKPNKGVYRALVFDGVGDAEDYIKRNIEKANEYVDNEFNLEAIQALIDEGLDDEDTLVSSNEFKEQFEDLYSSDDNIRFMQEQAVQQMYHSDDGGRKKLEEIKKSIVGDFGNGFNPALLVEYMPNTDRGNDRDAIMSAIKVSDYDKNKLIGNDFGVNAIKEKLVEFNPNSAREISDLDENNPQEKRLKEVLESIQDELKACGAVQPSGSKVAKPYVAIDDKGVVKWKARRPNYRGKSGNVYGEISGEIGQVMLPDENGIIETKFEGENNYAFVPGYTGYFTFDGDYDDRMSRFRVKGFDETLKEQLRAKVHHQLVRPVQAETGDIATTLDASSLNGLYHGDVYGKRIEKDFLETSQLSDEAKFAILNTLSNRVRFDNQYSDNATTMAETRETSSKNMNGTNDIGAFSYWKAVGSKNMRVLHKDIENYADLTMTGNGKTQGLIWYLTDGAKINEDGSVTPSKGMEDKDGNIVPDKTAVKKLEYFKNEKYNAWDRTQMSANQLMTALHVDEGVNTALITFGGWTFEDSYGVSKEFAERNQVFGEKPNKNSIKILDNIVTTCQELEMMDEDIELMMKDENMKWSLDTINEGARLLGEAYDEYGNVNQDAEDAYRNFLQEHGRFRPLQRGDKISDFGGNKGTIGIVVDRDMSNAEAKRLDLEKEVRFMKANPELDVIGAPYSMLSRHNAGVVKELMEGETKDLVDPDSGEVYKSAMGKLNIIVTDMLVDKKTNAYTEEDVKDGKGRKFSGQVSWMVQSKDGTGLLNEVYGRNNASWNSLREYLVVCGLDMGGDGTLYSSYVPSKDHLERKHYEYDDTVDSFDFLNDVGKKGAFLDVPFDLKFATGDMTNEIPVLPSTLRQSTELVDGTMKRSDYSNNYSILYDAIGDYEKAETDEDKNKAVLKAQHQFDKIQSTVIDRQFEGKRNIIREKIMSVRVANSASCVTIADPRRKIGEIGADSEIMESLDAVDGDTIMVWRDPVWRDGAIRAVSISVDETSHGFSINPVAVKSQDGDFDGDTNGGYKPITKSAIRDLERYFSHENNMVDKGGSEDKLYYELGMDIKSAHARATEKGETEHERLLESARNNSNHDDYKVRRKALNDLNKYVNMMFRDYGFGSAHVDLTNDKTVYDSFKKMVDDGAKGNEEKLNDYMDYHNGKKSDENMRKIQYAQGVKTDDTGLAGSFGQKCVSATRNTDLRAVLEAMYPVTQSALDSKHDDKKAVTINSVLSDDLNVLFRGKNLNNPKISNTPNGFKQQFAQVVDKLGLDINKEHIDALGDALTDENGQLRSLKDTMAQDGSPMDRIAYGGGFDEITEVAHKNESLLEGKYNEYYAPFDMRNEKRDLERSKQGEKVPEMSTGETIFIESSDSKGKMKLTMEQLSDINGVLENNALNVDTEAVLEEVNNSPNIKGNFELKAKHLEDIRKTLEEDSSIVDKLYKPVVTEQEDEEELKEIGESNSIEHVQMSMLSESEEKEDEGISL